MSPPVSALRPDVESELSPHAVREQLDGMLTSHFFRNSSRYPSLLRYLVEETLKGNGPGLKERLLGIEVFHRLPDYDTNADPVVRVTAAEVRKRLAQYYQEPEHAGQLRIELPLGSYMPRFHLGHPIPSPPEVRAAIDILAEHDASHDAPVLPRSTHEPVEPQPSLWSRRGLQLGAAALAGALLVLVVSMAFAAMEARRDQALRELWAPFTESHLPTLVVIGDHSLDKDGKALRLQDPPPNPSDAVVAQMNHNSQITVNDALSLNKVTDYLVRSDMPYRALGTGIANLSDLRAGPVLLFAGLDNSWTLRLTDQLRYRFLHDQDANIATIQDSRDKTRHWSVNFNLSYSQLSADYAIVARFKDPLIEQPVLVVAGLGEMGTAAASEFVTQNRFSEEIAKLAPRKNWKGVNLELVIATPVVDGHAGAPHVLAAEFW